MKFFSLTIALISLFAFFQDAHAEWQSDNLGGMQVSYYMPGPSLSKRALMVNLHGCAQKADDLKKDGNWEQTADDYNMIVALPSAPNGGVYAGCWDYYGADHTRENRHNAPVIKMVEGLLAKIDLNIDPAQVYISGLSSGGGEAMVLGCLAPEIFAGIGLNAGPSTGSTVQEISYPKTPLDTLMSTCKKLSEGHEDAFKTQLTSVIYGNNDYIVNTAFNINNAEIMRTIYGADVKFTFDTRELEGASTEGTGTMWSDAFGPRVSLIMNTGLGHNWPAGQGGNNGNFINKKSINYPDYLAKFFFTNNRRVKLSLVSSSSLMLK
jgi:poly(3-hydroxybutyrate) depolymerase